MSAKLAKLGLAAVLAYGLFDGVTYTTFFILAFLGYEKSTGKNPAANLQALLGVSFLIFISNLLAIIFLCSTFIFSNKEIVVSTIFYDSMFTIKPCKCEAVLNSSRGSYIIIYYLTVFDYKQV